MVTGRQGLVSWAVALVAWISAAVAVPVARMPVRATFTADAYEYRWALAELDPSLPADWTPPFDQSAESTRRAARSMSQVRNAVGNAASQEGRTELPSKTAVARTTER
jgi:hypothetical protein